MSAILQVELGKRSYPIHFGSHVAAILRRDIANLKAESRPVAVVTDENIKRCQGAYIAGLGPDLPTMTLPPGEKTKSFAHLEAICEFLAQTKLDRNSCLLAIGGGVVGDLTGYSAASFLRGIDYCQVPTTLLAMVDSSVGGKTGINLAAGKNLAGAFHQPRAVYVDTSLLATLPPREFAAGMAEVIKTALLADLSLFDQLQSSGQLNPASPQLPEIIRRCCEIKAAIVAEDEEERASQGGRALLNLGHTFAHAIEAVTAYGSYQHGEAVGLGLILAARLSQKLGHLEEKDFLAVKEAVGAYGLPVRLSSPLSALELCEAMKRDKKVRGGEVRFVILRSLGKAETANGIPEQLWRELWIEVGAENH